MLFSTTLPIFFAVAVAVESDPQKKTTPKTRKDLSLDPTNLKKLGTDCAVGDENCKRAAGLLRTFDEWLDLDDYSESQEDDEQESEEYSEESDEFDFLEKRLTRSPVLDDIITFNVQNFLKFLQRGRSAGIPLRDWIQQQM